MLFLHFLIQSLLVGCVWGVPCSLYKKQFSPVALWMRETWDASSLYPFLCQPSFLCSSWDHQLMQPLVWPPCSAFIDFSQTQRQTEKKALFRKKLNGQVADGGWHSPLYWRGGKMSLLWRPLRQIVNWLDECPQVRVEHVPPAAKREQIKGQHNTLELEVRFLSSRSLCSQHCSGCVRQNAKNFHQVLISGGGLPSDLLSERIPGL